MSAAEPTNGNAATYFVDSHIASGRAAKLAFREVDGAKRSLTYGQLSKESSRVAEAFAAAGIRRESRAAMLCLDPSSIRSFSVARLRRVSWRCL